VQVVLAEADRHRAVQTQLDRHFAATLARINRLVQLVEPIGEPDRVVVGDHALFLDAEDRRQTVCGAQRAMRVRRLGRRHAEATIVVGQQPLQQGVGLGDLLHLRQPHLFHPTILGGSERALDASLGLWTTCLDQLDVELGQSPRKLGFARIIRLPLLVRLEDAMPIRVQRQRPTILLQPSTQQIEMRLDRVGLVETRQRP